jgi:hypothetical protein
VLYPGVYRVGHAAPSTEADYMAAVLACGKGALLMGVAAAFLYRLINGRPPLPVVKAQTKRRIEGIETHRARAKTRGTRWLGIPTTTVPATLVDIAPSMPVEQLARACHEAQIRYGLKPHQCGDRMPKKLRAVLLGEELVTLSALEAQFVELLRAERLVLPITNRLASKRRVDCRWPDHRLTVELDSYTFHHSRHAWELDRRREREAYARGDQFRRYTYGDVFEDPRQMRAELHALLA